MFRGALRDHRAFGGVLLTAVLLHSNSGCDDSGPSSAAPDEAPLEGGMGEADNPLGQTAESGTPDVMATSDSSKIQPWVPLFETRALSTAYYAEGADVGDIDGDGHLDLVAGPIWFGGPDFHLAGKVVDAPAIPIGDVWSTFLITFVDDINQDRRPDVIGIGLPGTEARWYENPGPQGLSMPWPVHVLAPAVGGESPANVNLVGDDAKELVFIAGALDQGAQLGYAERGLDPAAPWTFHPISPPMPGFGRYTHGMGVGDVDGDGTLDVVERSGWWRQVRGDTTSTPTWERHEADFALGGEGGAQMLVYDVDGDGDSDIVTSLNAHGYGLSWFEQRKEGTTITFLPHEILAASKTDISFSQLHGLFAADMNGDGLGDVITGKRYFAHSFDPGVNDPAVLYWFELARAQGSVSFIPHLIHSDSGVGCVFSVHDLDGDTKPDIFTTNKKGSFVHLQR